MEPSIVRILLALALVTAPASWGLLAAQLPGSAESDPPVALVDLFVFDPGRAVEASGMTIVIHGGKVQEMFPTGSRPLPPGAEVRRLKGRYLLPGLIDAHKHLTGIFHRESPERMYEVLERMYHSGIVAMREMAGDARLVGHLADLAAAGELEAPEIFYSAVVGSPHFAASDPRMARAGRGFPQGEAAWAQAITPTSDLERAVIRAQAVGVTGLKVYLGLDAELLRRLTDEARRQGLKVWAHSVAYPLRPSEVVEAGVDSISHACGVAWEDHRLDPAQHTEISIRNRPRFDPGLVDPEGEEMEALFSEMARRGAILDPTVSVHARPADDPFGCTTDLIVALTKAAKEAGVPLVAGTDYETPEGDPFPALFLDLEQLVGLGILTPREALVAATWNAARLLGLEDRLGSIEPGKDASFLIVAEDPREDVNALRTVTEVVHRGKLVSRSAVEP